MGTAYGWTVYATMLTLLLAVIALVTNLSSRLETTLEARLVSLESRIDRLGTEMHHGFAQVDNRLRVLERS